MPPGTVGLPTTPSIPAAPGSAVPKVSSEGARPPVTTPPALGIGNITEAVPKEKSEERPKKEKERKERKEHLKKDKKEDKKYRRRSKTPYRESHREKKRKSHPEKKAKVEQGSPEPIRETREEPATPNPASGSRPERDKKREEGRLGGEAESSEEEEAEEEELEEDRKRSKSPLARRSISKGFRRLVSPPGPPSNPSTRAVDWANSSVAKRKGLVSVLHLTQTAL